MQSTSKQRIPECRLHKSSGLGTVRLQGRDNYLGPCGTPESHARYRQVIGEWLAAGWQGSTPDAGRGHNSDLTIDESIVS